MAIPQKLNGHITEAFSKHRRVLSAKARDVNEAGAVSVVMVLSDASDWLIARVSPRQIHESLFPAARKRTRLKRAGSLQILFSCAALLLTNLADAHAQFIAFPLRDCDPSSLLIVCAHQLDDRPNVTVRTIQDTGAAGGSIGERITAGLALGALGAAGGWFLGSRVTGSSEGGIAAAALAEGILLPIGVQLATPSANDVGQSIGVSIGIAAIGFAFVLAKRTDAALITTSIVVPLVQLPLVLGIQSR